MAPKVDHNEGANYADLTVCVLGCVGLGHNEVRFVCGAVCVCLFYVVCTVLLCCLRVILSLFIYFYSIHLHFLFYVRLSILITNIRNR